VPFADDHRKGGERGGRLFILRGREKGGRKLAHEKHAETKVDHILQTEEGERGGVRGLRMEKALPTGDSNHAYAAKKKAPASS